MSVPLAIHFTNDSTFWGIGLGTPPALHQACTSVTPTLNSYEAGSGFLNVGKGSRPVIMSIARRDSQSRGVHSELQRSTPGQTEPLIPRAPGEKGGREREVGPGRSWGLGASAETSLTAGPETQPC